MTLEECLQQIELYENQARHWRQVYQNSGDSDGDGNPIDPDEQAHLDTIDSTLREFRRILWQNPLAPELNRHLSDVVQREGRNAEQEIDRVQEALSGVAQDAANLARGIPVAEQAAGSFANSADAGIQLTAGVLQGAASLITDVASTAVNPYDTAQGIQDMITHVPTPFSSPQEAQEDAQFWENAGRAIIEPYERSAENGDYVQAAGRVAFDVAGLFLGGGRAVGAVDDAARAASGASRRVAGDVADGGARAVNRAAPDAAPARSASTVDNPAPARTSGRPAINPPPNPDAPPMPEIPRPPRVPRDLPGIPDQTPSRRPVNPADSDIPTGRPPADSNAPRTPNDGSSHVPDAPSRQPVDPHAPTERPPVDPHVPTERAPVDSHTPTDRAPVDPLGPTERLPIDSDASTRRPAAPRRAQSQAANRASRETVQAASPPDTAARTGGGGGSGSPPDRGGGGSTPPDGDSPLFDNLTDEEINAALGDAESGTGFQLPGQNPRTGEGLQDVRIRFDEEKPIAHHDNMDFEGIEDAPGRHVEVRRHSGNRNAPEGSFSRDNPTTQVNSGSRYRLPDGTWKDIKDMTPEERAAAHIR